MEVVRPQIAPEPKYQRSSVCPILYSFLKIKPILLLWPQMIRSVIHTAVRISMYRLRGKKKIKSVWGGGGGIQQLRTDDAFTVC